MKITTADIIESVDVNFFIPRIPEDEKKEIRDRLVKFRKSFENE